MAFYPAGVPVPEEKRTNRLLLRPLRATDVELDYDAVMSSAEQLRRWSQRGWPADDFTRAENLVGLQGHEREHRAREAFTFTVLNPPGTRCLGCVYLMPLEPQAGPLCVGAAYAANVGFWVRTSELANDLTRICWPPCAHGSRPHGPLTVLCSLLASRRHGKPPC